MKLSCPLEGCHSSAPVIGSPDGIVLAIIILALIVCVGIWLTRGPRSKNEER